MSERFLSDSQIKEIISVFKKLADIAQVRAKEYPETFSFEKVVIDGTLKALLQLVCEVRKFEGFIKAQERIINDLLLVNAFQRDLLSKRPTTYLQKMRGEE